MPHYQLSFLDQHNHFVTANSPESAIAATGERSVHAEQVQFNPSLPVDATSDKCEEWLRQLVRDFGPGFHPDTPSTEYIDASGEALPTSITNELTASIDRAFAILGDERPYEIGADEARELILKATTELSSVQQGITFIQRHHSKTHPNERPAIQYRDAVSDIPKQ